MLQYGRLLSGPAAEKYERMTAAASHSFEVRREQKEE